MLHGENNTPVVTRVLLILEDVATHNLRIWHGYFGVAGLTMTSMH